MNEEVEMNEELALNGESGILEAGIELDKSLKLVGLERLVDEENVAVRFAVYSYLENKWKKFSILRTELTQKELQNCIKRYGGICPNDNRLLEKLEKCLNMLLLNISDNTEYFSTSHSKLGWKVRDDIIEFDGYSIYRGSDIIQSRYSGQFDIEPMGDLENIKSMMNECIIGNVPMQCVMTLGAAATSLGYSNLKWKTQLYNPIIHLISNSSRGKSTAAKLVASFIGKPEGEGSCSLTFQSTDNANLKIVENVCGVPFSIDEFSCAKTKKDCSDFLYTLSNGVGKSRCAAAGAKVQLSERFQTVFVSNGENSILQKCNQNEGLRTRVFEICLDSFTRSADESDKINEIVSKNYGILTPLVAQELMENGDKWNDRRIFWKEYTKKKVEEEKIILNTVNRIIEYVALFTMSCELLNHVLDIKFEVEKVFEFFYLYMIFKNAEDANIGIRVYDFIKDYVAKNSQKFYSLTDFLYVPDLDAEHIGYEYDASHAKRKHIVEGVTYDHLFIFLKSTAEEILRNRQFEDIKIAMRDLAKMKLLRTKGDRVTWEIPVKGVGTSVYAFWIKAEDMSIENLEMDIFEDFES